MSIELVEVIDKVLGALGTIAESIEKATESIIRTSGKISSVLEGRKLRRIADSLAPFYFTPVGIRKDLEIYINKPTNENLDILENKLEENQEIINKFQEFLYDDMDSSLFILPMSNIDYLFGIKSELHREIYNSRYTLEELSSSEKQKFLDEINLSFEKFNQKLEETIKNLSKLEI